MASNRNDYVVVVDVEATCWEGMAPEGQTSDIIEIGVCLVETATGRVGERGGFLVLPERSTVSPFCTGLTTLTPELVAAEGIPFAEACARLEKDYLSNQRVWASYGEYDKNQFDRQCRATGVRYPFGRRHVNVKTLFALASNLPREVGMARALEMLAVPLDGTHHRGCDDAFNIAGILSTLVLGARSGLAGRSNR